MKTDPNGDICSAVLQWQGRAASIASSNFCGYVLLAFLRAEFIDRLHWLTENRRWIRSPWGQLTPGPEFTTATFIGYVLAGVLGAFLATLGIFLPGFVFVGIGGALLPKIRRSPIAAAVLDGVVVGSLALMAVVPGQLARASITDWLTFSLLVASVVLILRFKLNSAWLILGCYIYPMDDAEMTARACLSAKH